MTLRTRHLLVALLAALTAALFMAASASAEILSFSGAERPLGQDWASYSCADASRVQQVDSPVAQGKHAWQLEVQDGDYSWGERCEIGMGNPWKSPFPLFNEGDERWISFQVYLPDDYPIDTPDWNVFFQIHQTGDGGCPPLALHVENGQYKLFNTTRNTYVLQTYQMWSAPAVRNHWAKFTLHMMNSTDDNKGFIEIFGDLDGTGYKQLMPKTYTHTATKYPDGTMMTNHARVGIYRNPAIPGNAHILFDGFTIATDRESAESAAFGDAATPAGAPGAGSGDPGVPGPGPGATTTPRPSGSGSGTTGTGSGSGSGSTDTPTSTTPPPTSTPPTPPAKPHRKHRGRVILRTRTKRARHGARSSGRWPRVLPVYGWVKAPGRKFAGRSVVIQVRRHGHWVWLSRGWLRADGRFYLAASLDSDMPRRVTLRAHVKGLGYSKALRVRV
jgi:Polysaccharide lyase